MSYLAKAKFLIEEHVGPCTQASQIYLTKPWGYTDQDDFYNQVLRIETPLEAGEVLEIILRIEEKLGRVRNERWTSRIIDIDILLFNDDVISEPGLHIPHSRMAQRNFVLAPLAEIAGDLIHPVLKISIGNLKAQSTDPKEVFILAVDEPATTI